MKIALYLLFLVVLLIATFSLKEGFETGKYAYLAPPKPYILDETTKQKFITAYNNLGGRIYPNAYIKPNDDTILNQFKNLATLDEINYYIQNNRWPINSYVTNYAVTNKSTFDTIMKDIKIYSLDDLYRVLPVRAIYAIFINVTEAQMKPVPLSNDIFMGKQPPPVDVSVSPTSDSTIRPPFSSENYSKLQSICSTLN